VLTSPRSDKHDPPVIQPVYYERCKLKIKPIQIRNAPHTECDACPIREMALFQGVPRDRLEWTQKYRDVQLVVPPKATLYEAGSKPKYVYTLFNGWMAMYQTSRSGKRKILRFVLPGDFLGFQANLKGTISHSASAISESIVCAFPRDTLSDLFEKQPSLAFRLASMESREMNLCQHHQAFRSSKDSHESIAFLLLELFHRTRLQMRHSYDPVKNSIVFPLTQEDIGDAVGLTSIHVNRVIGQFRMLGLIECDRKTLQILSEEKLAEIGEFDKELITSGDYFSMK